MKKLFGLIIGLIVIMNLVPALSLADSSTTSSGSSTNSGQGASCADYGNSDERDKCYTELAMNGDYSVCSKISNPYLRESCYPTEPSEEYGKHYLVVGDDSPANDVILAAKTYQKFKNNFEISSTKLNSEVRREDLKNRVTAFIYNNRGVVIVGSISPSDHVVLAVKLNDYLASQGVYVKNVILDTEVNSDDLITALPDYEANQYCKDSDNGMSYMEQGKTYTCKSMENGETICSVPKYDECNWCTGACIEGEPCKTFCGAVVEYYCKDEEIKSVTKQCENGCENGACIKEPQECIQEGKKGSMFNNDACCDGLNKISNSFGSGNECTAPSDSSFLCTQCGNGVCGRGENECNCPQDCKDSKEEVEVEISPSLQTINEGEKAIYKINIQDNHPKPVCAEGATCGVLYNTYNVKVTGLPFATSYDEKVRVINGESKTVELVVNPNELVIYTETKEVSETSSGTSNSAAEYEQPKIVIGKTYSFQAQVQSEQDPNAQARAKAQLVVERLNKDYVDVYIEPKSQSINYGDYAKYEITVVDKHPLQECAIGMECLTPRYTYQIQVNNLPFAKEFPKEVIVAAGGKETFALVIKPYELVLEQNSIQETAVESVAVTKAVSATGQALLQASVEETAESIAIPNYYEKEYKFSVTASQSRKVMDTAYAVLKIKPIEPPITPPPFPTEEVRIQLNKGWNLISLPGKLVNFEKNGLRQKLLGFVYLKDEQKYVTMQEAQESLGEGFSEYLATNAFWVYSYEDYVLKGKVNKEISFDIKLNSGWNLVPITEDMVGGYLSDLKGNCEFEKIYLWDSKAQSWDAIDESFAFSNNDLNKGIIVKATDYCTMAGATILLTPPAMPE